MVKIVTVDYSNLQKQSVGRPKTTIDKGEPKISVILKTDLSKNYKKVKFKIRNNVPSLYFTNRETNVIGENEYLNDITNNSFSLQYDGLGEGFYDIVSVGYHWFELRLISNETNNCCIVNKIKE